MDKNPTHKLDKDTEALCGHFTAAGAVFVTPATELAAKLASSVAGVDGLFIEAHPEPPKAMCDAASQYYLEQVEAFVQPLIEIHDLVTGITAD